MDVTKDTMDATKNTKDATKDKDRKDDYSTEEEHEFDDALDDTKVGKKVDDKDDNGKKVDNKDDNGKDDDDKDGNGKDDDDKDGNGMKVINKMKHHYPLRSVGKKVAAATKKNNEKKVAAKKTVTKKTDTKKTDTKKTDTKKKELSPEQKAKAKKRKEETLTGREKRAERKNQRKLDRKSNPSKFAHTNKLLSDPSENYFWQSSSVSDIKEYLESEKQKKKLDDKTMEEMKRLSSIPTTNNKIIYKKGCNNRR